MNDTLIFLVLAGLALIFKWLTSQASSDSKKPKPPSPNEQAPRRPPAESEEERVRRFLEALGAPPGTQPPPPIRRRSVAPRAAVPSTAQPQRPPKVRRSFVQPLPPLTTAPPEAVVIEAAPAPVFAVPPPLPPLGSSIAVATAPSRATTLRVMPTSSLAGLLRTRASIRQAIVLREVLGPPRGLQPIDQLRG
jgi:hypothetical protein